MTVGLSLSPPSAMNQHEPINQDARATKERTPFDRAVELAAATYARYNSIVATWFPPVPALLSIASFFCMYSVGLAVYFDYISNIPLFSLDRLQQSSAPYIGANWFCVGILATMSAWVFTGTGVYLHQPTWRGSHGKKLFAGLALMMAVTSTVAMFACSVYLVLADNLLNALGSSCGSSQIPAMNNPTVLPVCTARVVPANRSPVWEVFGFNSSDGCRAIRAVDTKKVLLYLYLAISAWTLHVSVTTITHLHQHVFDMVPADPADHDGKGREKGQSVATAEVASTVIVDSPSIN